MASRTNNPRFDHTCRIYRMVGGTETTMPTGEEVIYEGKCYIYEANNLRAYKEGIAYKEDMGCDVPYTRENEEALFSVRPGDLIDYDRYGTQGKELVINTPVPSKMGCTYRFNHPKI